MTAYGQTNICTYQGNVLTSGGSIITKIMSGASVTGRIWTGSTSADISLSTNWNPSATLSSTDTLKDYKAQTNNLVMLKNKEKLLLWIY